MQPTTATRGTTSTTNQPSFRTTQTPGLLPESLVYLLEDVFGLLQDSILHQALDTYGCTCFLDATTMTESDINGLQYPMSQAPDANGNPQPDVLQDVPNPIKALLHALHGYIYHREHVLNDPITTDTCMHIDPDDYQNYRCSGAFMVYKNRTIPQPLISKPSRRSPAEEFDRGIKLDPTYYPTLSSDKQWDTYHRELVAVCRTHGLTKVLDPKFKPTASADAKDLFDRHQSFLYQVFVKTLLTDHGKKLVRHFQPSYDAQSIYADLCKFYTKSVKASTSATDKLRWLTTTQLTADTWPGTHESFILHWQDQVRQYHALATHKTPDDQLQVMLENAVSLVPHLREVQDTAKQLEIHNGRRLTFDEYTTLLESAAQIYDASQRSKPSTSKSRTRHAYVSDVLSSDLEPDPELGIEFNIDTDLGDYHAYRTSFSAPRKTFLPNAQWQQLDDAGRRAWHQLPEAAKAVILGSSTQTPPPPPKPPNRSANLHEMSAADFLSQLQNSRMGSDSGTLTSETSEEGSGKLLAHVTKQTSFQPGELQRVLSDKLALVPAKPRKDGTQSAKKHEIVVDGVKYKACHANLTYSVLRVSTRKYLALVDRGANGGIAGDDVRIITKTNRSVDVQGIDNHQVTDIPIVTCAGLITTQRGPAIAIMNQFAHIGKGQSILSSAQMEHFGIQVDDKSSRVGGLQRLSTPDGFVIPIDIKNGLPYMRMRPPTDRELSNPDIPHVVLTSDVDWDPSALDCTIDVDEWVKSIPDDGSEEGERPFDRVGLLKSNKTVTTLKDSTLDDALDFFESFDCVMPTDGMYELHSRPASELDWFECNMADLFDLDPTSVAPDMPPEFEVYESRRRPSVMFVPETPIEFDIESTPVHSKPVDLIDKSTSREPRRNPRRHTRSQGNTGDSGEKTTGPGPPPRDDTAFVDVPGDKPVYKNPSSAVKSRERDWERLRKYFAWLPKLVIQKTFDCTTQLARIPMSVHLQRHYRSPFPALNVHRRSEAVATDTVYADTTDIEHGHVAAQFYVGLSSLVSDVYGVTTDAQFLQTLQDNVRKRGAPTKLVSDRAQAEVSQAVKDYLRWLCIDDWQSAPHRQNQNPAERRYQDVKRLANRILDRSGAPPSLWLLALRYASFVYNHTAVKSLGWLTPIQALTGVTPDISVLLRFEFYEKVYYKTEEPSFPSDSPESLGYMVGIAEHVGHAMTYKILTPDTNKILFRSEIRSATSPTDPNKRLAPSDGENLNIPTVIKSKSDKIHSVIYSSDDESDEKDVLVENKDLIGRTFLLKPNEEGHVHRGKIIELIDQHHEKTTNSPALTKFRVSVNEDEYEEVMAYAEILERLEADEQNPTVWKFKRIVSHQGPLRPDHPSYMGSSYNVTMEWENGEITPEPLGIIGADDPVACAIYARDNNLLNESGWKRFKSIAKREKKLLRMVNQAKLRSFRTAPKYMYGYEIPKDYNDALRLDKLHGNTKWADATKAEMDQLEEYKVFIDLGRGTSIPKGFQKIRVHLVYACKHDGRHKARLVADGHLTDVPVDSVYSGVVSIRGLKIMIFLAELNGLDLWATDIGNAYLEAYTKEKVAIIAGPEFGELQGHTLVVSRALYGLRMSGKMWHQRFAACLQEEGFFPCKAEPDIWMRPLADGSSYEYVGVYVDDLAMVMKDPKAFVDKLVKDYKFKLKGTGPLNFHLGCDFGRDENGVFFMSPRKYIERMVESYVRMFGSKPKTNVTSPLEKGDHPECDTSKLLDAEGVTQYQSLVGQLQWAISLGRMDVATAVMSMSSFRSTPRIGHLHRVQRICGYLVKMKHACIRFRTGLPDYTDVPEPIYEWANSVYGCPIEEIPSDAPTPLGLAVILTHYVDANLYHCMLTGRSVTGVLHVINGTPIDAFTKKQSTVETATYGSEFVAARTCVEQIMDLRYTLRYLGVPIQGRSYMFGDNESVVNSSSKPDAKLHKRHVALSFHRVREAVASNMLSFIHMDGAKNPADILSKHWGYQQVWPQLQTLLFWQGDTADEA